MTFDAPEGEHIHVVCYRAGGASIQAGAWYWCGSARKSGWHEGEDAGPHAQYFCTVKDALRFARAQGWIGE